MPLTVAQAIIRAQITYPDLPDATALLYINDVWSELNGSYNLRDDYIDQALVAEQREYTLAETASRVQAAYYYSDAVNYTQLGIADETELDRMEPGWRDKRSGTPSRWMFSSKISSNTGILTFALDPKPELSTLLVSGATNATPIVVSTTTHGLSDGDPVLISNVGGNTNANGLYYADITNYGSTTSLGLFSDADLTVPVAGNSGYTSGGTIITSGSPGVRLYVHSKTTFITSDNLPNIPATSDIFVKGLRKKWAESCPKPMPDIQRETLLYNQALADFERFRAERQEGRGITIKPYYITPRRVI